MTVKLNRNFLWPALAFGAILLFNLLFTPGFFHLQIKAGHLYGYLVDIINQTDAVENLDGEDKLGQPMARLRPIDAPTNKAPIKPGPAV